METLTKLASMGSLPCSYCGRLLETKKECDQPVPYRNVMMRVPESYSLPWCQICKRWTVPIDLAKAWFEKPYRTFLRRSARGFLAKMKGQISQRALEQTLGLSQGYLCRIGNLPERSDKAPSPELVSHLLLIAEDPLGKLNLVRQFWREAFTAPSESRQRVLVRLDRTLEGLADLRGQAQERGDKRMGEALGQAIELLRPFLVSRREAAK